MKKPMKFSQVISCMNINQKKTVPQTPALSVCLYRHDDDDVVDAAAADGDRTCLQDNVLQINFNL